MKIEKIKIEKLIPYVRNSRTHSDEQVAQIAGSIREFGFNNPVLIDAADGIIAGHGRVMAARKLEMTEVPCVRLGHLSETQRRAYVIADNKLALNATWDSEALKAEVAELAEAGFDLALTGFNEPELAALEHEPSFAEHSFNGKVTKDFKEAYDEAMISRIVLMYEQEEYAAIIDAMGQYADQHGLSSNAEVLSHLLETNGYAISQRKS